MSHLQVAVLSDIHGNLQALNSVLADVQQQGIENIIVAGDSTGALNQNQVFSTLREKNAILIRGNGEKRIVSKNRGHIPSKSWDQASYAGNRWVYSDLDSSIMNLLEFIPDQRVVEYAGASPIRVVHGSPKDTSNAQGILPEQSSVDSNKLMRVHSTIGIEEAVYGLNERVLICGHTHRPWVHRVDDITVINPGSVGNPCNGDPKADYAILTWGNDQWSVEPKSVDYDLKLVYDQFHESGIMAEVGVFARTTLYCRLTGIDVTLEFLLYVKELLGEGSLNYEQAYSAAANSFDWKKYEVEF